MSLQRLFAIARKEFHHVTRDVRTLFLVTIAPAILLVVLTNLLSFDADHAKIIVLDQDQSDLSRQYIADLTSDGTFQVMAYLERYDEIDVWIKSGQAKLALVIPPGTAATLQAFRPASVQAILDGVDTIGAAQSLGQLNARTNVFSYKLLPAGVRTPGLLDVRTRVWYNPSQKSMNGMVPGLMAVVLYMPALALSLSLTREKELGSFEGLSATPIHGLEYLLGKTITYLGFGLVSLLPVMLVATLWFHVPFEGNLWVFLVMAACYFLASFGLSHFVSSLVGGSQQAAMMVMLMVFFAPSFFLAGLILPVDTSSLGSQAAAYSLPVTHFIFICRGVFLKGLSLAGLIEPMLALLAIAGLTAAVSLILFRKWIE